MSIASFKGKRFFWWGWFGEGGGGGGGGGGAGEGALLFGCLTCTVSGAIHVL